MQITVKLFASFRAGRFIRENREVAAGTSVAQVADALGIALSEIGIIMINGRHAEAEQELHDGATLSLFPLLGGG
ncbi:MAG: MoaD/ThiS family protein [Bacteroidales bacterium]